MGSGLGMSFDHLTKRPHTYIPHPHKVIDRTFIAHAIAQMALNGQLKKLRIATLPSVDWENEILLDTGLKQCGIRGLYHGIEANHKAFLKMTKNIPDPCRFKAFENLLSHHISDQKQGYDIIIADYLGNWTEVKSDDIQLMFSSESADTLKMLFTTFSLDRIVEYSESKYRLFKKWMMPGIHRDIPKIHLKRVYGVIADICTRAKLHGISFRTHDAHVYPGKGGRPFATVAFACNELAR